VIRPSTRLIHLDTSFLIRALVPGTEEAARLAGWLGERRSMAVSVYAWGEFLCGPLREPEEERASRIASRHIPVGTQEVTTAASLFNHSGRRRGSFPDCIIAATAILADAELATSNASDFERFTDAGLVLAE
jgi:predicted nucleic acid-binding protein